MSFTIGLMRRYSGRKSCPHSEMQCASSTATKLMRTERRNAMFSALVRLSGATYNSLVQPSATSRFTCSASDLLSDEFRKWATRRSSWWPRIASTWFFINAMSGLITKATPSIIKAGSW